jgi:subfamily B ATP-binding cassette protein MsbA
MKDFIRILRYTFPYRGNVVKSFFCNSLYALFSIFTLGMIVPFVSLLFGLVEPIQERPPLHFSLEGMLNMLSYGITRFQANYSLLSALLFVSGIFIFCSLISNLFRYLGMYYLCPVSANAVRDLRKELFEKTLRLPFSFYTQNKTGDILTRFHADIHEVDTALIWVTVDVFLRQPLMIIFFVVALLMINPWLTLLSAAAFPAMIWVTRRISLAIKRKSGQGQEHLSRISAAYEESISGLRIIKGFAVQEFFKNQFFRLNRFYSRSLCKVIRYIDLSASLSELLSVTGLLLVLLAGSLLILGGKTLSAEGMILFLLLFARLIPPIHTCIRGWGYIQKGLVSALRVFEILDSTEEVKEETHPHRIASLEDRILFRDVCFGYNANQNVLENINIEIKKGETVAIVGDSGGGKSTLMQLLLRFYDVRQGQILIDGVDIRAYRLSDLRRLFGVVSQDVLLFHDTVEANIALGVERYTQEEVVHAARVAQAHEFIMDMPQGYQTPIGDRGVKLSGGQRQRLSIARAVMGKPSVFLLDEATSSLDSVAEQALRQALDELTHEHTCLVISHRLSTIEHADSIWVFKESRIVEQGTHEQLLQKGGYYYRLAGVHMGEKCNFAI